MIRSPGFDSPCSPNQPRFPECHVDHLRSDETLALFLVTVVRVLGAGPEQSLDTSVLSSHLPCHSLRAIKLSSNFNYGIALTTKLFCIGQIRVRKHARSLRLTVTNFRYVGRSHFGLAQGKGERPSAGSESFCTVFRQGMSESCDGSIEQFIRQPDGTSVATDRLAAALLKFGNGSAQRICATPR